MSSPTTLREVGALRRQTNRESTPNLLASSSIEFTSHNSGAHLRVKVCDDCTANLWPGTGLWDVQHRCGTHAVKGRGVFHLIAHIRRVEARRVRAS